MPEVRNEHNANSPNLRYLHFTPLKYSPSAIALLNLGLTISLLSVID